MAIAILVLYSIQYGEANVRSGKSNKEGDGGRELRKKSLIARAKKKVKIGQPPTHVFFIPVHLIQPCR